MNTNKKTDKQDIYLLNDYKATAKNVEMEALTYPVLADQWCFMLGSLVRCIHDIPATKDTVKNRMLNIIRQSLTISDSDDIRQLIDNFYKEVLIKMNQYGLSLKGMPELVAEYSKKSNQSKSINLFTVLLDGFYLTPILKIKKEKKEE